MRPASGVEATIAEAAARQHGVVTKAQLLNAGLSDDVVRSRLRAGRLVGVHQGVYLLGSLVGSLCPPRHREMAAVLACGRGAAVGHRSALWLLELLPARPRGPVHLILENGRGRCRRPEILAHRVAFLPESDVEDVSGIPTATATRSILDAAGDATAREVEQVIARAERLGRLDIDTLRDRVERAPRRPGSALLRTILAGPGAALTRSEAEERLLELVRKADLPHPRLNVTVFGFELDVFWPDHGVAVEIDGFAYHASRRSFERDRARDFALGANGIEVHRVTWRQLESEPLVVLARLAAILARTQGRQNRGEAGSPECELRSASGRPDRRRTSARQ